MVDVTNFVITFCITGAGNMFSDKRNSGREKVYPE